MEYFQNSLDHLILNAVIGSLIKINKWIVIKQLFILTANENEHLVDFALTRLKRIYFVPRKSEVPSLAPGLLWEAVMHARSDNTKMQLIELVRVLHWCWPQFYMCLRLTSHFGETKARELGVVSILKETGLLVGLDSEQKSILKVWFKENPNMLIMDIYNIFEKNWNSKKDLEEFPELQKQKECSELQGKKKIGFFEKIISVFKEEK